MPIFTGSKECKESTENTVVAFEETHTWPAYSQHTSQPLQTDPPLHRGLLRQAGVVELMPLEIAWGWMLAEEVSVKKKLAIHTRQTVTVGVYYTCSYQDTVRHRQQPVHDSIKHSMSMMQYAWVLSNKSGMHACLYFPQPVARVCSPKWLPYASYLQHKWPRQGKQEQLRHKPIPMLTNRHSSSSVL